MVLVTQGWALDTKVNISGLHVIDIDGDGTQEIIVSAGDKNIFIKNGSIIKTEKPKYPQEYIAHVDIDHDGRVEKIYVERGILYYEKDNKVMWKYEFGKKIKQIVLGDADADKSNEIIVLTEDETLAYLKTYGKKIWEKNIPGLFKCEVGDVNGDGTDELIVASKTCIYVIRVGIIVQKISGREILDISIGDVNGDGIKELIVAEKKRYLVIDMRKTEVEQGKANIIGTNVFQKEEILQIDVVDIDRDMKAEVIVLLKDRIDAYRLKNELVFKADIKSPGFIVHGDINGDTVNELVVVFSKRYVVSFELLLSGPRLFKFAEILSSSEKILIDDICHAVGIGRDELFEFLLLWSGIINYRIEGEYIVKIKRVTERVEIQNINGMIILSTPRRKILYDTLLSTLATRFIFLMLKESGVHIFNLTLGHKLENPELLAGLITALRSLGSEVGFSNTGKVRQFFEHGFQILMVDGDYTTLVLLMKRKPDEQFMENALRSVNEIEKT
ncbi:MAG: VCBS repeat-containing protein, partial [Candidatus Korarchaeota archaeon]